MRLQHSGSSKLHERLNMEGYEGTDPNLAPPSATTVKLKSSLLFFKNLQKLFSKRTQAFSFVLLLGLFSYCMIVFLLGKDQPDQISCKTNYGTWNVTPLTILLWTWPLKYQFPLNNCPNSEGAGCFYTTNRTLYPKADAVVISHREVYTSEELLPPEWRPPDQYWIWFSMESPSNCLNLALMDNKINLTMTYRLDSDIFTPYGWLEKANGEEYFTIPKKSYMVAWVVSNWNTKYRRTKYYEELKKYIKIDVFGKKHLPLQWNETFQTLAKYKFYLAFENSFHEDYITEKFWKNAIMVGTVPIVMGLSRENYERFVPADAFIHVDDFSSPQELAKYLWSLDEDENRYQQYFKWRFRYQPAKPDDIFQSGYCKICRKLKAVSSFRTIPSIAEWFK